MRRAGNRTGASRSRSSARLRIPGMSTSRRAGWSLKCGLSRSISHRIARGGTASGTEKSGSSGAGPSCPRTRAGQALSVFKLGHIGYSGTKIFHIIADQNIQRGKTIIGNIHISHEYISDFDNQILKIEMFQQGGLLISIQSHNIKHTY